MPDENALTEQELVRHLIGQSVGGSPVPIPFAQDIFLCDLRVAGTPYYSASAAQEKLEPGKRLTLRRETDNQHDPYAIEILTDDALKLGYVPRDRNEIAARLLDAGKMLFLEVERVKKFDRYIDIRVKLHMSDY